MLLDLNIPFNADEEKIKNEYEISSLFDAKERHREVKEEMARECFLLSKKSVGKVSE